MTDRTRLHELVVKGSLGGFAGCVQELLEALSLAVVNTVGAHDVELAAGQVLLDRPESLDLAADSDEEELVDLHACVRML